MKIVQVPWGKKTLEFKLPGQVETFKITASPTQAISNLKEEVQKALEEPIESPPLQEIVKPGETVVIIVSDITRLSYQTASYLAIVINELNKCGIPDEKITIVVATAIHRAQTKEEHRLVVGEEVFSRVKIENHDCQAGDLVHLGYTSRGTEITINRTVYDAERVILTGGISYHLLAGFGGGRKSIAPGVCGYDSIQQNHGLALKDVDSSGINPGVVPGVLKGNPVSEDMFEIAEAVKPDFLINVVVNEKKEVISVVAGDIYEAFEAGCKIVEKAFGIQVHGQSDVVISSCGGYPKDIQLYQSIKGLDNAAYVVKERGVIILASECSDGAGSDDFLSWFKGAGVEEMRVALNKNFTMPGFVALRVAGIMARARVILLSILPEEVVKGVGMLPAGTPEEAWAKARHIAGEVKNITYMPHGSLTFPIIKP